MGELTGRPLPCTRCGGRGKTMVIKHRIDKDGRPTQKPSLEVCYQCRGTGQQAPHRFIVEK